jgi:hypothetical protein
LIFVEDKLSAEKIVIKAKPVVRQGRKATGFKETAGLLKELTGQPGKGFPVFYYYVDYTDKQ